MKKAICALVVVAFMLSLSDVVSVASQEIDSCEGDFDCDGDIDGMDAATFKVDFGRSQFKNPCTNGNPCNGDFDCDGDVDGTEAPAFKQIYGRNFYDNPCSGCFDNVCEYEECIENCGEVYPNTCPEMKAENCASGKCGIFDTLAAGTIIMCVGESPDDDPCSVDFLGDGCCHWDNNWYVFDTYSGKIGGVQKICCSGSLLDGDLCDCIYFGEPVHFPDSCCSKKAGIFENGRLLCIHDQSDLDPGSCLWDIQDGSLYVYEGFVGKTNDIYYICENGLKRTTDLKCTGGFYGKEMIGRVTSSSATLNMVPCQDNTAIYVEYGTISENYDYQSGIITRSERETMEVKLDNLLPNTRYYYKVMEKSLGEDSFSPRNEATFITKRNQGEPFSFAVTADDHYYAIAFVDLPKQIFLRTLENIYEDNVDFQIDLGDSFCTDFGIESVHPADIKNQTGAYTRYESLKKSYGLFHHSIPFYLVLGNHEGELGFNWVDLASWSENARKLYIPNPDSNTYPEGGSDDENYYAFTWGDALFIALDPYRYTINHPKLTTGPEAWTLGSTQLGWLENVLKNSDAIYKFIFIHHLVGGCNSYARGGVECADRGEWGSLIHPLLFENNVDIVFHGHDHAFSDEIKDGIRYTLVPNPHNAEVPWADNDFFYDPENVILSPGHLRVTVNDNVLVEYIGASLDENNKEVKYTYTH